MKLEGGQARPVGRESEYGVYSAEAASLNTETVGDITQADASGVAKYHGFQDRLANAIHERALKRASAEFAADGGDNESTTGND